jgi:hypothetical protein
MCVFVRVFMWKLVILSMLHRDEVTAALTFVVLWSAPVGSGSFAFHVGAIQVPPRDAR